MESKLLPEIAKILTLPIIWALMAGCSHVQQSEAPQISEHRIVAFKEVKSTEASAEYHFGMAQAYSADGQLDRAIEEYQATLSYDPKSALIHARLAAEYVKKGDLSRALEFAKLAITLDGHYTDARLLTAGLLVASKDFAAAIAEYNAVIAYSPNHEEAWVYRAQTLTDMGQDATALKQMKAFLAKNPESALGWYTVGRTEQRAVEMMESVEDADPRISPAGKAAADRAIAAYHKTLELRPSFEQASLQLGYLYEVLGNTKQAIKVYQQAYDEDEDPSCTQRLATVLLKNERYAEALPYLQSLSYQDPDDLNVQVKLGLVQMELKRLDDSIKTFKKILSKNPEAERIHYYLGNLYAEQKKVDLAIESFRNVPVTSKLYGDSNLHIAYLQKVDGHLDDSRKTINQASEKQPRVQGYYFFLASLEEEEKNFSAARTALKRGVELFPEDEKLRYYLGSVLDRMGETDSALEQMQAVLKINPDHADALNFVGYNWLVRGVNLDQAGELLKHALAIRPDNAYVLDSWGWYLYVRGRHQEAMVQLEKAARLQPNEAIIFEHLGDIYSRLNLRSKALAAYSLARSLAQSEEVKTALAIKINAFTGDAAAANRHPASE